MKYIIVDPDKRTGAELNKLLDSYETLDFQGNFTSSIVAEVCIIVEPPDVAFLRLGVAGLNAFKLAGEIEEINPCAKIIFVSGQSESAVEAFEFEADGFLLTPFNKMKIEQLIQQNIGNNK